MPEQTSPAVDTGIVAFIEARLNERRRPAAAEQVVNREFVRPDAVVTYRWVRVSRSSDGGGSSLFADGAPSPARVLAEVAKDRAILALHRADDEEVDWADCVECGAAYPCQTVRLLAAIDADHPDYDPSWKPVAG